MADNTGKTIKFVDDDQPTRMATAQVVGDGYGFVSTSAESAFRDKLVGYNLLTGTYSIKAGNDVHLSIDSRRLQDGIQRAWRQGAGSSEYITTRRGR